MTRKVVIDNLEYLENKRIKLAEVMRNKERITFEELTSTLFGLTGVMYEILDHIRRKEGY